LTNLAQVLGGAGLRAGRLAEVEVGVLVGQHGLHRVESVHEHVELRGARGRGEAALAVALGRQAGQVEGGGEAAESQQDEGEASREHCFRECQIWGVSKGEGEWQMNCKCSLGVYDKAAHFGCGEKNLRHIIRKNRE